MNAGNNMHTCFYESWCSKEHVEDSIEERERLVNTIEERIKKGHRKSNQDNPNIMVLPMTND